MSVIVRIPTVLQPSTGGRSEVEAQGTKVREALDSLIAQYPESGGKLFDEEGNLRKHVVLMVNDEDIRFLQKMDTPLKDGDEVLVLPSMSGGR